MNKPSEIKLLRSVCEDAKQKGKITGTHLSRLNDVFGHRFVNSWNTVKERRVKKYTFRPSGRTVWIVVGRKMEYLVMPAADFCSCDDFYYHVMDGVAHLCYHLIAQKIANSLGWYDLIKERDDHYDALMAEWKKVHLK